MVETEPEKSVIPTVDTSNMKYVRIDFYDFLIFSDISIAYLRKLSV